jgi:SulP family sulfate permease
VLRRALPLIDDLARTHGKTLGSDLLAGTITAVLLIPQALAYALLAGLPPEMGLYASTLPPIVYALSGSSRVLAVGPVAVAAVMVSAALLPLAEGDPASHLSGALMLSMLSGGFLLLMALLRLGWLTHFISHPVLSGFTTGAAIYIIGTQLGALTGIAIPREAGFFEILRRVALGADEANRLTVIVGTASVLLLFLARQPLLRLLAQFDWRGQKAIVLSRTAPLLLVVLATVVATKMGLGSQGVATVGTIPAGLPGFDFSFLRESGWTALAPSALMIALIGYVESISVAKALAFRRREKIDPDRELMALGLTNVAGACVGAMPVAGGFARSMVNFEAGARTQLAAIVTAIWVGLGALFFTGWLHDLPKAVLAAIIVVAVFQLIDLRKLRHTWAYDRADGLAQGATIIGVLVLGVESGLMLGAALGTALFLHRTSRPHIAVVGRVPGTEHYRNVHRHEVESWPDLLLVRVDENLYFANASRVELQLMDLVTARGDLKHLVLICSGVSHIDASGLEMLESIHDALNEKGIALHLAEVKGPVMDRLTGTPFLAQLGVSQVHLSTDAAVRALHSDLPPRG